MGSSASSLDSFSSFVEEDKPLLCSGKYQTEEFLDQGCFGKVIKCKNVNTGETVAVKVMKKKDSREGLREAQILKKLKKLNSDKNNLLMFIENFNYNGHVCLAFEMLDRNLHDFMSARKNKPVSVSDIKIIARQLLVSLNALKSIGIIHTDIKPDNVMLVDQQSQPFKVKLIDFGLALQRSQLYLGQNIQPLGYRAPEVILGLPIDESMDMWSLGCLLAFLYLRQHLYSIQSEYETIKGIVQMQGQPSDDLLKKAIKTSKFFTEIKDNPDHIYRLKTPDEYKKSAFLSQTCHHGVYTCINSLDDLPKTRRGIKDPTELKETQDFISLLKEMLHVDSRKRITPKDALNHSFMKMKHLPSFNDAESTHEKVAKFQLKKSAAESCVKSNKVGHKKTPAGKISKIKAKESTVELSNTAGNITTAAAFLKDKGPYDPKQTNRTVKVCHHKKSRLKSAGKNPDKESWGGIYITVKPCNSDDKKTERTVDRAAANKKGQTPAKTGKNTTATQTSQRLCTTKKEATFSTKSIDSRTHKTTKTCHHKESKTEFTGKCPDRKDWNGIYLTVQPCKSGNEKNKETVDRAAAKKIGKTPVKTGKNTTAAGRNDKLKSARKCCVNDCCKPKAWPPALKQTGDKAAASSTNNENNSLKAETSGLLEVKTKYKYFKRVKTFFSGALKMFLPCC